MFNEQGEMVCSFLDQSQPDELDLFAELDEIQRGITDFQIRDVADEEKSKIRLDLRSHFAYLEHIAILTGDSAWLEPDFHKIELAFREFEDHQENAHWKKKCTSVDETQLEEC